MPTINDLRQQAATIKNATQVGENTATRVGTTFETIADLLEQQGVGQGIPSVDLSQLNTLRTPADQTTINPTIYNVTTLHNLSSTTIKVGTLFIFSDGGRAVVTQILLSNYQVDGGGNISSPNTSQITMYYRMFNIVQDTWSAWTLYGGGGGGETIDPYPVSGSDNAVASNGVFEGLQKAAPEVDINDIDDLDDYVNMQTGEASTYTIKAYHNLSSTWLRVGVLMVFANQANNTLTQICISNCMVDGGGNLIPNYTTNVMNVFYRFKQFSGNPPEGMTIGVWTTWAKFGDSGYQPDNEDIDLNASDQLQFANKLYDASSFSGLGRVYLRKNIVTSGGVEKNVLTQAMVNTANTIYHIQYDYDLNGQTITLPAGCALELDGGSVKNGTLVGNNTFILNNANSVIFDNVTLTGTFSNDKAYLSWYKTTTDVTDAISNITKIAPHLILDKGGVISSKLTFPSSLLELDAQGNTFTININDTDVDDTSYYCLLFDNSPQLKVHDIKLTFGNIILGTNKTYAGIEVLMPTSDIGFFETYNVEISDFDNRDTNPCDFIAFWITRFNSQNGLCAHDIYIHDNVVLGDGVNVSGVGANHGLRIQTSTTSDTTGLGDVYNIHCKRIFNCDPSDHTDLTFQEDAGGLYLCAPRTNGSGEFDQTILLNVHDCVFEDCSLRAVKVQGNNAKLFNISNKLTTQEVDGVQKLITKQARIVDFQGADNLIDGFISDCASCIVAWKGKLQMKNCDLVVVEQNITEYLFLAPENKVCIFENVSLNIKAKPLWCVYLVNITSTNTANVNTNKLILNNSKISYVDKTPQNVDLFRYTGNTTTKQVPHLIMKDSEVELSYAIMSARNNTDSIIEMSRSLLTIHGNGIGYRLACLIAKRSKIVSDVDGGLSLGFYSSIITTPTIDIEDVDFQHKKTANTTTNILNITTTNSVTRIKDFRVTNTEAGSARNVILLNGEHKLTSLENVVMPATHGISCKSSAGLIEVKNCAFNYFNLTENTPATIAVEYNNNTDPVAAMLPYITRSVRAINLSSLPASGQKGVTYWYNGKPIYWNGTAFVDATGAALS